MSEYVYQPYPAWRYHPTEPAVLVPDEAADKALGKGWVDRPVKAAPRAPSPPVPDWVDHECPHCHQAVLIDRLSLTVIAGPTTRPVSETTPPADPPPLEAVPVPDGPPAPKRSHKRSK